ncbi:MAG: hypothetical protein Q8O13_00780 [Candidatus Omnitrophota bacterium]|nr:hypothetical protein [Candidatus Omnitrophota bacterium]
MKKSIVLIIILGLIVLTGFSLSRYFYLQKANLELERIIKENKAKIDDLANQLFVENELNEKLKQEKQLLSNELKELSQELKQHEMELSSAKDKLSHIQTKLNLLKKENLYLSQLKASFDVKMEQANQEKAGLEAKFNSIEELKKAIYDLKDKMRRERLAARKESKNPQKVNGNKGYIIWRGQPTLKSKVRIEVTPAP